MLSSCHSSISISASTWRTLEGRLAGLHIWWRPAWSTACAAGAGTVTALEAQVLRKTWDTLQPAAFDTEAGRTLEGRLAGRHAWWRPAWWTACGGPSCAGSCAAASVPCPPGHCLCSADSRARSALVLVLYRTLRGRVAGERVGGSTTALAALPFRQVLQVAACAPQRAAADQHRSFAGLRDQRHPTQ